MRTTHRLLALALLLSLVAPARVFAEWRLPGDSADDVVRLVTGGPLPLPLGDGLVATDITIDGNGATVTVDGPGGGALALRPWCGVGAPFARTTTFGLWWDGAGDPPSAVQRLAAAIAERDDGTLRGDGDSCAGTPSVGADSGIDPWSPLDVANLAAGCALVALVLLGWALARLARLARQARRALRVGAFVASAVVVAGVLAALPLGEEASAILRAYAVGAAMVCLPFAAGLLLGAATRLLHPPVVRGVAAAALAVAIVVAALAVIPALPRVAALDVLAVGVLAALGALVASVPRDGRGVRRALLGLGGAALALAALFEVATRLVLPAPPGLPRPDEAHLVFMLMPDEGTCSGLFPDAWPAPVATPAYGWRTRFTAERPVRVLFLGDSVPEGAGVPMERSFPELLSARQPRVAHVNAAYGGTGPDFHLLVARTWMERVRYDLVVLVSSGNDPGDMENRYLCCPGGPLLTYPPDGPPRARCATPTRAFGVADLLRFSPAPYPLRVASGLSRAAGYLCALLAGRVGNPERAGSQTYERALGALIDEVRSRGVPLVFVQHYGRSVLEEDSRGGRRPGAVPAPPLVTERGVPILDLATAYRDAAAGSAEPLFLDVVHLSERGHVVAADFLERALAPWLPAQPAVP